MFNKTLLLFVSLAVISKYTLAISDEQKAHIQSKFLAAGADCIADNPLSADDIIAFKDKKIPDGDNAGCFAACLFKKIGLLSDKGVLDHDQGLEKAKTVFEDEDEIKNVAELLTTCAKVNDEEVSDGEKGCDRARLMFTCLVDNSEKFGFNVDFN